MMEKKAVPSVAGFGFQEYKDLLAAGLPHAQIEQLAEAGFTFDQLMEIAEATKAAAPSDAGHVADITRALERAGQQVRYPQNLNPPMVSAFSHPEGEAVRPKARLTYETYFCGARQDEEALTPREIELFNAFNGNRTARNGLWRADFSRDGRTLLVTVPAKSLDDLIGLPSMELICQELLKGVAAVDPISLAERVAELEAQLAARA